MMTADRSLLEAALSGYEIRLREVNGKIAEIRAELESPTMIVVSRDTGKSTSDIRRMPDGSFRRIIPALLDPSEKGFLTRLEESTRTFVPVTRLGEDWPKRKRNMSAAARKRIGAAQRKRWAAWRKAQGAK